MPKMRIVVEVDIPDERDIPKVAAMAPKLVQATTRTVHKLIHETSDFPGECQGQVMIVGDGLADMPIPDMPPMLSDRRRRLE